MLIYVLGLLILVGLVVFYMAYTWRKELFIRLDAMEAHIKDTVDTPQLRMTLRKFKGECQEMIDTALVKAEVRQAEDDLPELPPMPPPATTTEPKNDRKSSTTTPLTSLLPSTGEVSSLD
jgi:hypothetical protein